MTTLNHKESGNAALIFVMMFPFLIGMFILGTDGARALQDKARLEDAAEVATLTVAAQNSDDDGVRQATAKKIVQAYFPNATVGNIDLTRLACEDNPDCNGTLGLPFFQYALTNVTISEDSWLYSNDASIASMGKSFDIKGSSIARKYQSQAVDVVLVSDYSASMYNSMSGSSQAKYKDLNDIVVDVAAELEKFNKLNNDDKVNTLSIVGFDMHTSQYGTTTGQKYCYSITKKNSLWKINCKTGAVSTTERVFSDHLTCYGNNGICSPSNPGYSDYSNYSRIIGYYGIHYGSLDATSTVANIFNTSKTVWWPKTAIQNISVFHTVPLTDPTTGFFTNSYMTTNFYIPGNNGSGTASYTGLIRGAQIANTGKNPRRIIIMLSDGEDSHSDITDKLINAGMCSTIMSKLNSETVDVDGVTTQVKARLAAVGFDYDVKANPQMANCVGSDNVYRAQNPDDIKNKILELITEEIGHSAL